MFSSADLAAAALTLRLAGATTLVLLVVGTPIAWWLARTRSRLKPAVGAIVALPLVLPPTVIGFYLLVAMGPEGPLGRAMLFLGLPLLPFTFWGLVVASVVYSMPFVVQPLARPGLLTAIVLGFAHTMGEFGVVLMIGGNIPGQTRVLSVLIFDHVEALDYAPAHALSAALLGFSFVVLLLLYALNPLRRRRVG